MQFTRLINLPREPKTSFFLWGPRQVGKSWLLHELYPNAMRVDLLNSDQFLRYHERPSLLRDVVSQTTSKFVVIDEVQKVPLLLDEVHWLIENRQVVFALCGSSARRVKQGQANLLGGRARRYELFGLLRSELGAEFDLVKLINRGNLPRHYLSDDAQLDLDAYVGDYLKEEIVSEAVVRNVPRFIDFLRIAAICDTEIIDYTKVGSECGVTSATARNHFQILEDSLMSFMLPAYTRRSKRRVIHAPKFYFCNVGVVNQLAKRRNLEPGSELFGKGFENFIVNEVRAWNSYKRENIDLSYWRLSSGGEVDLIFNDCEVGVEIKSSVKINNSHLKGLRALKMDYPKIKRRVIVSLDPVSRKTEDGIEILHYTEFLDSLWA